MDNNTDKIRVLDDRRSRTEAERSALKCGVRADLKGFNYLVEAAVLYGNDVIGFNEIYRRLGARHGVQSKSIMREITYAVKNSPEVTARLASLTGKDFDTAEPNSVVIQNIGMLYSAARETAAGFDAWV